MTAQCKFRDWSARFETAALDPSQWLPVLQELADATGSTRGQLIGFGDTDAIPFNWVNDLSSSALDDFVRIGGASPAINFRIGADHDPGSSTVVFEPDYMRARVRAAPGSDTYVDFCRDNDILWGCQTMLIADRGAMVGLAMLRSTEDGWSSEVQRAEFARAAPAARTAVRMQRAIEHQSMLLAAGALEAMSVNCLLIDGLGRVGAMTAGAERLMADGRDLAFAGGILTSPTLDIARHIALGLRAVLGTSRHQRIALDAGRYLDIFGLARRDWALSFVPSAIVVIRDRHAQFAEDMTLIAQMFGLSPAEAQVAAMLARGLGRDEIMAGRSVSAETLKTQIKLIYQKTGCNREGQLVALIASLRGVRSPNLF